MGFDGLAPLELQDRAQLVLPLLDPFRQRDSDRECFELVASGSLRRQLRHGGHFVHEPSADETLLPLDRLEGPWFASLTSRAVGAESVSLQRCRHYCSPIRRIICRNSRPLLDLTRDFICLYLDRSSLTSFSLLPEPLAILLSLDELMLSGSAFSSPVIDWMIDL